MTQYNREGVNWGELVLGIVYIIVAFISFRSPDTTLSSLSVLLGIIAILSGVGEITLRNKLNRYYGDASNIRLISGVMQIIIGIIILLNLEATYMSLPIIFAFWFIFNSVMGFLFARPLKRVSTNVYWAVVVLNILGLVLGVLMINNPLSTMVTLVWLVGFYFLVIGIRKIIQAF